MSKYEPEYIDEKRAMEICAIMNRLSLIQKALHCMDNVVTSPDIISKAIENVKDRLRDLRGGPRVNVDMDLTNMRIDENHDWGKKDE